MNRFFNKTTLKVIVVGLALAWAAAVFFYPFPAVCGHCSLIYRLSFFLFGIFGVTAFVVPFLAVIALFFYKSRKVRKYLKLWLFFI